MKSFWQYLHKVGDILHLPDLPVWFCGILVMVLVLRIPSFFEPYYYGDEMIYLTLGQGVRQGLTLYKDLHDNKPPLLYWTAALAGNLFWFKVILAGWSIITIYLFYKLAKKLFQKNESAQKISTLIFALITTLPLLEGTTVNSELFMIGFSIWGLLLLIGDDHRPKRIYLAGTIFGLGSLFKIPAAFDAPVIVFYWIMTIGLKEWKKILKNTAVFALGFASPILITFIYYFFKGALVDYIKAAFLENIGYLSSFRPGDVQKPFLVRNAPLLTRAAIVFIGSSIVYLFRKKLSKKFILLTLWTLFALFAITLSERPYPHYFLQAAAPISFLFAILFSEVTLEQSLTIIPLSLAFFVPVYYKFWIYPTTTYYTRFINFASSKIGRDEYFNEFDPNTARNYKLAEFLSQSSNPADKIFVWDPEAPTIYALSRRLPPIKYVVPYHVNDFSSAKFVAQDLRSAPPKFIILTTGNPYPEIASLLSNSYIFVQQIEGASIYVRRSK